MFFFSLIKLFKIISWTIHTTKLSPLLKFEAIDLVCALRLKTHFCYHMHPDYVHQQYRLTLCLSLIASALYQFIGTERVFPEFLKKELHRSSVWPAIEERYLLETSLPICRRLVGSWIERKWLNC